MRLLLSLGLALAGPALAQQPQEPPPERVRHLDFDEADEVRGRFVAPFGEMESVRPGDAFGSLVKVRLDFRPELLDSARTL